MVAQIANALPGALNGVFQETFGTVGSQLTWITAAFMIPVVVFELTFGVLGDKYGHRSLVVGGAGVVMIGSLVCAVSPTVEWMWVGSAINGLGAGAVFPASLALVASVAETSRERIRGIAMWAGFLSAGSAASPLLGGILAGFGWWRAAYVVVAASGLTALAVALWKSRDSERQQGRRPDLWGQITFALGLILVLFGLVQGPEEGWSSTRVMGALIVGVAFLVTFVVIEIRVPSPLLDLRLFRIREFTVSSAVAVIGMFAFLGACFATSMWLGPVQHQNPLYTGLLFLLLQGPAFAMIPLISRLQNRFAARGLLTAGFLTIAAGGLLASNNDVTNRSVTGFILPSLLVGIGFALTLSPMTSSAVNSVPRHLTGTASAATNLLRDLGFALGPVLVGAVALSTAGNALGSALTGSTLPSGELEAARATAQAGGPIAVNSLPTGAPGSAAQPLALEALGQGFAQAFVVISVAALVAALLSWFGLRGVGAHAGHDDHDTSTTTAYPVTRTLR
jgi:EmrB/QacA subfamily drug resistance transporter